MGAVPVDFSESDPVEQIFKLRKNNKAMQERLRPGEDKMKGVDCVIDAVGYQARGMKRIPPKKNPHRCSIAPMKLVNPTGALELSASILHLIPRKRRRSPKRHFPFSGGIHKGVSIGCGQLPVKKYNEYLRDLIIAGRATPGKIVSHHITIDGAPEACTPRIVESESRGTPRSLFLPRIGKTRRGFDYPTGSDIQP